MQKVSGLTLIRTFKVVQSKNFNEMKFHENTGCCLASGARIKVETDSFTNWNENFEKTERFSPLDRFFLFLKKLFKFSPYTMSRFFSPRILHNIHYIFLRYLLLLEYKRRLNSYRKIHAHVGPTEKGSQNCLLRSKRSTGEGLSCAWRQRFAHKKFHFACQCPLKSFFLHLSRRRGDWPKSLW